MKIAVCIRPVPDPVSRLATNETKTWIKEADLTFVPSEADTYALEEALRLREAHGGEVVALSVGQDPAARVLRSALATGADRAIHLSDESFNGGERPTARVLAQAIETDGGADLVLTGVQSDDLGTGITGVFVAELLGWPHASVVISVEARANSTTLTVRRELENGVNERVELDLPCVLTIQYGINKPRYASLKGIMAAKKKEIKVWGSTDLGLSANEVGVQAAMYDVNEVFFPERQSHVEMLSGSPIEIASQLVERLRREAKVL